jgi:lipopolysaccharide transport system ATP-binding protein
MGNVVIQAEGLSKLYRIGGPHRYGTLRASIANFFGTPLGSAGNNALKSSARAESEDMVWALRDVSFQVYRGEVVGIIGRNGAGKSTLLKILSRITEPTSGEARIFGRVGSLLEVGTGFHPELTGRENIYLNGAILGMNKAEIQRKFDAIVDFAEVEKFLDTPVKHYSSGMYMRLAFAVAAHLDPDILLVDEVLAVGDAAFQKKCLAKMDEAVGEGRTVLFVSHNMGAVNALCRRVMIIERGSIVQIGETSQVTADYLARELGQRVHSKGWYSVSSELLATQRTEDFKFTGIELFNPRRARVGASTGDPLLIQLKYVANRQFMSPVFWISLKDLCGHEIARFSTMPISGYPIHSVFQDGCVDLLLSSLPLVAGHYYIDIAFAREQLEFITKLENVVQFQVQAKDIYGSGLLLDRSRGLIAVKHQWDHRANDQNVEAI